LVVVDANESKVGQGGLGHSRSVQFNFSSVAKIPINLQTTDVALWLRVCMCGRAVKRAERHKRLVAPYVAISGIYGPAASRSNVNYHQFSDSSLTNHCRSSSSSSSITTS